MSKKPKCIIVTGRPGSGKTTLSKKLGERLCMPVISRDMMKEGYVNTFGIKHDELPPDTNVVVNEMFFGIVNQHLAGNISVVIEAAFQHKLWAPRMPKIQEVATPVIVLCSVDGELAARRHLERGLEDSNREFYHSDKRVADYRRTGEISPPESYTPPKFDLTTIQVSTESDYLPSLDEIVRQIRLSDAQPDAAANQSQPVRADTNKTSEAAGSGR